MSISAPNTGFVSYEMYKQLKYSGCTITHNVHWMSLLPSHMVMMMYEVVCFEHTHTLNSLNF